MKWKVIINWKINIKNGTCQYFENIANINDLYLDNILLDEKMYENILTYDVGYNIPSSRIIFDKVHGCIRQYDRTK